MTFDGMTMQDAARALGKPYHAARVWLFHRGYRVQRTYPQIVRKMPTVHEVEDQINQRTASARPSAPCFRCGAREGCRHR